MKNRKEVLEKVKAKLKSEDFVVYFMTIAIILVIFTLGSIISSMVLTSPLTEEELQACEDVAIDIYLHGEDAQISEEFEIYKTDTEISVALKSHVTGKVILKPNDNEDIIIIYKNSQTLEAILTNMAVGFGTVCIFILIVYKIVSKLQKKESDD